MLADFNSFARGRFFFLRKEEKEAHMEPTIEFQGPKKMRGGAPKRRRGGVKCMESKKGASLTAKFFDFIREEKEDVMPRASSGDRESLFLRQQTFHISILFSP